MFYLVHAGTSLQVVSETGTLFTTITLPAGVTLVDTLPARFAVLTQQVVVANAVSVNIWIDPTDFSARILGIPAPVDAGVASAGGAGLLTGAYAYVYTFTQKISGVLVNESPPSPMSNTVTLADDELAGTIDVSTEADVTGRRIYRTAAGGTDYFMSIDVDDNTSTSFVDNTTDEALADEPLDTTRGNAPGGTDGSNRLYLLVEWKDYLWGVCSDADQVDNVYYTDLDQIYAWSLFNLFPATPKGADAFGVTGFIPRRDALGVGKRDRLIKITGSSDADFQVLTVYVNVSLISQDSVVVVRDAAYFLGSDGVYRWDDTGVSCISRPKVDPWFTTSLVFDRTQFASAFAGWNPLTNGYRLNLVPTGGSAPTAWVEYAIDTDSWFGPHGTAAFAPSCRALLRADDAVLRPAMGGADGFLYLENQAGGADVDGPLLGTHAIAANVQLRWIAGSEGDLDATHYFGRVVVLARVEAPGTTLTLGGTLGVPPTAGLPTPVLNAVVLPLTADLTQGRQVLGRIGVGNALSLTIAQATVGQQFLVYGLQFLETFVVGIR